MSEGILGRRKIERKVRAKSAVSPALMRSLCSVSVNVRGPRVQPCGGEVSRPGYNYTESRGFAAVCGPAAWNSLSAAVPVFIDILFLTTHVTH